MATLVRPVWRSWPAQDVQEEPPQEERQDLTELSSNLEAKLQKGQIGSCAGEFGGEGIQNPSSLICLLFQFYCTLLVKRRNVAT